MKNVVQLQMQGVQLWANRLGWPQKIAGVDPCAKIDVILGDLPRLIEYIDLSWLLSNDEPSIRQNRKFLNSLVRLALQLFRQKTDGPEV